MNNQDLYFKNEAAKYMFAFNSFSVIFQSENSIPLS